MPIAGLPLIGNLHQIPPFHSWLQFKAWGDIFGPIYEISIAGRPHIMVSSEKIANDLLRERGNLYSSREQLPMAAQLLSDNLRPLLLPYNDVWRNGRKLMHALANTTIAPSYERVQLLESARVLYDLIRSPGDYERWFERYAAGLVLRLAYGKTVETGEEPHVKRILHVVHTVERLVSPGAYLVDTFPILMKLPKALAPFKQEAEVLHAEELSLFREGINDVRQQMAAGTASPSFARSWLEKKDAYDLTDDEAAYVVGTLFEAGAGTTSAAMMSFTLAMVHYPKWQGRLQDEIDFVVGDSRLPTFADIPNLPTVRAVVKETLRWRPVTAGGVPHQLIKDDVYDGFFIPAGANIHGVQWAIHRDPELYPDPETFNPARWLEKSYPTYREPLTTFPNLQNYSSFGFGRYTIHPTPLFNNRDQINHPQTNLSRPEHRRAKPEHPNRENWMGLQHEQEGGGWERGPSAAVRLHIGHQCAAQAFCVRAEGKERREAEDRQSGLRGGEEE
jgi:cytochrome P450